MESTQLPARSEFSNYTKNLIDRSPASPTFLQRRIASHSSYENLYPPSSHSNFFLTSHAVTTRTPPPTHSKGIEPPKHRAGSSAEDYINLKAYVESNQTSPVKRSRNNSSNVNCQQHQQRVLVVGHVKSNVSPPLGADLSLHQQQLKLQQLQQQQNCFVNYGYCHEDEYENTASYMRFFQQTQQGSGVGSGGGNKQLSSQGAKQKTPPFCSACAQIAATLPTGWAVNETEEGIPYFIDHNSRSTHWRLPWLPPCLNCELIHNELMIEHGNNTNSNTTSTSQHSYTTNRPPPPPIPRRKPLSSDEEKSPLLNPTISEVLVSSSTEGDQGFGVPPPATPSTAIHNPSGLPPPAQVNKQPLRPIFTNYTMMDTIPAQTEGFQRVSTASSASLLDPMLSVDLISNVGGSRSSTAYMAMYPSQQDFQFQSRHQEAMRRMPPARPLTRLPNALPLDVAVAEESSKRLVEELRSPITAAASGNRAKEQCNEGEETVGESEAEDAPKRPRHPSVESQLLYLLDTQPDFFMDTYYKADEKLDRMLDFNVFNSAHLEAMRDSLDRKYFEECQAVCAAYERYRIALAEKIQKKMEAELKEKHKRQLNHIKSTRSAKSNLSDHRNIDNISLSSLDFDNE